MFFLPAIIFLLRELAREALHSISWRGSCSFAALTSECLLAAWPGLASYGFSHCRAFPLGTNHSGLVQLLPQDEQSLLSLCTTWEVFRSCLLSDTSAVVSLLWWGELRVSSQPQRCSLWWSSHPSPAGCLAWHAAAVSQLATPPTSSPALGGESLMAQGRGEQEEQCRGYLCSCVPGYLSQVLDCSLIKPKFS